MTQKEESPLGKFFSFHSKPTKATFPELTEYVIWFRAILGVFYGFYLGLYAPPNRGAAGLLFGLNVVTFIPIIYCSTLLGADTDSYGSQLLFGGVMNSVALLLLIWVYFYTIQHEDAEMLIKQALLAAAGGGSEGETAAVAEEVASDLPPESEF